MANCVLMDGKSLSNKIRKQIKDEVEFIKGEIGLVPGLAVVLVGEDPASQIYVRNKEKACEEVGFTSRKIVLPENIIEEELLSVIDELNNDNTIHGILVQLPLPKHIDKDKVIDRIATEKDVDIFKTDSMGKIFEGTHTIAPCTPSGIMALIDEYNIELEGKHCVVIGRSNIVGKPMIQCLLNKNATVTVCHSKTSNLPEITRQADILVAAIGRACLPCISTLYSASILIIPKGVQDTKQS